MFIHFFYFSDKGENVWDWYTHKKPSLIVDQSTGDVACDSYHKYKEDVAILKDIGVGYHIFRNKFIFQC